MSNSKIMVVEDETIVALDIKNRLVRLGFEVIGLAQSGEEAIVKVTEGQPDLVLMDIRLKGDIDGIEAAERIRSQQNIPVIFLTAYSDEATLQRAKMTGPYGYILKPFEEQDLRVAIEMALYHHRLEQELKENRQWLATTLKSIGDAVIATDAQGCIKFMNPVAEALTGWKEADALGQNSDDVFNIINGKTDQQCESPIKKALRTGVVAYLEDNTSLITREREKMPVDDSAAPIRDDRGNVTGAVLVFRDITERREVEEHLRQYALELQTRNEELDAFAHTVAHDLQGPLGPIVGVAELLQENHLTLDSEEVQALLKVITRSGQKISRIIRELLLLAGVRHMEVRPQPVDMGSIMDDVQLRLAHVMEETPTSLTIPEQWPKAMGYGPWIEEVWINYISNAIKYGGQPAQVEVGANLQSDGTICFWVCDNGPGLKPEDQSRLFTPFTRLDRARATGNGLGLSIVRRIVEKLGGQVGVESVLGSGSRFTFTLAAAADEVEKQTAINNEIDFINCVDN